MRQPGQYHVKYRHVSPDTWVVALWNGQGWDVPTIKDDRWISDSDMVAIDERIILREEPSKTKERESLKDKEYVWDNELYGSHEQITAATLSGIGEVLHDLAIQTERIADQGPFLKESVLQLSYQVERIANHLEKQDERKKIHINPGALNALSDEELAGWIRTAPWQTMGTVPQELSGYTSAVFDRISQKPEDKPAMGSGEPRDAVFGESPSMSRIADMFEPFATTGWPGPHTESQYQVLQYLIKFLQDNPGTVLTSIGFAEPLPAREYGHTEDYKALAPFMAVQSVTNSDFKILQKLLRFLESKDALLSHTGFVKGEADNEYGSL
jgi:hypothetical protein